MAAKKKSSAPYAIIAHKLRDPKFYTARTKRAVNSLTVERGPDCEVCLACRIGEAVGK